MNDRAAEFDVIVVGAGISGGLPAGAYLQKAGCSVAVIERDKDGAPFSSFYERPPGVRFDVTPVNFSIMSPATADLDLANYGYRFTRPETLYSTLDGAGRPITFFADPIKLKDELTRYSSADASTFLRMLGWLGEVSRELLSLAFFTPTPDRARAIALTAAAVGIDASDLETMNAPALVERLFESDAVRIALTALPAINLFGDLLSPGQGALAWLWSFLMRACTVSRNGPTLSQAVERAFLAHGGVLLKPATATRLVREKTGRCCGVEIVKSGVRQVLRARNGIISDLGADLTSTLVQHELRSEWHSAGRTVFTADVVLSRPLAWPYEGFLQSPRVYLLWDSWPDCVRWLQSARDEREEVFLGHLELTQFSNFYGCAPDGSAALRVRFGTGPYVNSEWDARRAYYESAVRRRIHELDPDVRITSVELKTPRDYWHWNPAARHGNPVGGDFVNGQWMEQRLPYRTQIPGLYMSNSVWPTSLSWMAPGYNVAKVVAADIGVKPPSWWSSTPLPSFELGGMRPR
jgi:phytoene dehydrogenase-like protein